VRNDGPRPGPGASGDFGLLLQGVQAGHPAAWEECYRRFAPAVGGYLRLQGARDVDDLTSEVFLAVFRGIGAFTGDEANFRSWVFVIAHRRLQDERRRRYRRPEPASFEAAGPGDEPASLDGHDPTEDEALRILAAARVTELCEQLGPDQRAVVLLRVLGDLTVDQVADVLGKSSGAVKQLQRRAFGTLRGLLEREGVTL